MILLGVVLLEVFGCTGQPRQDESARQLTPLQNAGLEAGIATGLPPLPDDAGRPRAVSAEVEQTLLGSDTFIMSDFADPVGDTLVLQTSPPAPLQFGIYEFPLGGNTPLNFSVDVEVTTGQYWLVLADFNAGAWQVLGPYSGPAADVQTTPPGNYDSPGGNLYAGVIAARLDDADSNVTINSVTLTSDDGVVVTFAVSGTITEEGTVNPLEGINVQLNPGELIEQTNAAGEYEFSAVEPGDYTLIPMSASYLFVPPTRDVTVADADVTGQDFSGTERELLYGEVLESGVTPVEGVSMHLVALNENGSINLAGYRMATTDAAGSYEFEGMVPGDYRLVPQLNGWVFSPNIVEFTYSGSTPQGFTGTEVSLPETVTYDDHIRPWLLEPICMQCHDSAKSGVERNFAPATVNWDTYGGTSELFKASANLRIKAGTMPPATLGFGTTQFQKDLYQAWLDDGFPEN